MYDIILRIIRGEKLVAIPDSVTPELPRVIITGIVHYI